jgi:hypothetical protein
VLVSVAQGSSSCIDVEEGANGYVLCALYASDVVFMPYG